MKQKKAQEEIVGFAIIVIIVSIILVFFLVFSLSEKKETESYEAESFLQSSLQYTSDCTINGRFLAVQDLIFSCYNEEKCDEARWHVIGILASGEPPDGNYDWDWVHNLTSPYNSGNISPEWTTPYREEAFDYAQRHFQGNPPGHIDSVLIWGPDGSTYVVRRNGEIIELSILGAGLATDVETCSVLNETLKGMLEESWQVGEDFPVKGYNLKIFSGEETILSLSEGNVTQNSRGAQQVLPKGVQITASFNLYY